MRKSTLLMGAVVAALAAGPAAAADFPVKARVVAPIVAPFSWTGCYIGVHAGGGAARSDYDMGYYGYYYSYGTKSSGNGGLAGGQVGCNYQTGVLVLGVEGEGYWSGMKARQEYNYPGNYSASGEVRNKYDFTVAGRFGIAYERAFIYGKAGWAWGKFDFNSDILYPNGAPYYSESGSATLNGPLFGLGVEYALTNNWTVKGEYNYINFGLSPVNFAGCYYGDCVNYSYNRTYSHSAEKHIFKFGVNYLFNVGGAPLVAKY